MVQTEILFNFCIQITYCLTKVLFLKVKNKISYLFKIECVTMTTPIPLIDAAAQYQSSFYLTYSFK